MMVAGFTAILHIATYMTIKGGLTMQQMPYVYLLGGAAILFTTRWVGRLLDFGGQGTDI